MFRQIKDRHAQLATKVIKNGPDPRRRSGRPNMREILDRRAAKRRPQGRDRRSVALEEGANFAPQPVLFEDVEIKGERQTAR